MATIAVVGPGAVGGTVAAWLDRAGHDVGLCVRTPFEGLAVDTPEGPIAANPRQLRDPGEAGPVDWVLVTTKAYDVAGAARWLERLAGPGTRVAVLQNGVEHVARFAEHVPAAQILPVMVDIPAERDAPGRIRQRRRGAMLVPAGVDGRDFAGFFAGTGIDVDETDDFLSAVWRKLCVNSAGAVMALTLEGNGVAWREPAAGVMRALVAECIAVGRAEGADLDESLIEGVVQGYRDGPRDGKNSIHADREAGRPMEWDARNGVVVRLGQKHGIATPVSAAVTGLLAAIDAANLEAHSAN
ncbi:MAG: 2-dehydropantoate 2-reductase [Pseudomonadota bacterium]